MKYRFRQYLLATAFLFASSLEGRPNLLWHLPLHLPEQSHPSADMTSNRSASLFASGAAAYSHDLLSGVGVLTGVCID